MHARSLTGLVHRVVGSRPYRPTLQCDYVHRPLITWRFLTPTPDPVTCQLCGGEPAKPLSLGAGAASVLALLTAAEPAALARGSR